MGYDDAAPRARLTRMSNFDDARASSPCVNLCTVDPLTGYCIGCGRTVAEVVGWRDMGAAGRRTVLAQLGGRLASSRRSDL